MTDRLAALTSEAAAQGLLMAAVRRIGTTTDSDPNLPGDAGGAVWRFLARPEIPDHYDFEDFNLEEEPDAGSLALALVVGARRIRQEAEAIELAAAQFASKYGITIRQFAEAIGIAEESSAARYPRDAQWEPGELHPDDPGAVIALEKVGRYDGFTTPPEILAKIMDSVTRDDDEDEDDRDEGPDTGTRS